MKVLIADDVLFMRKLLSNQLTKFGYEVIEAENGEDAVRKCIREQPDLVFMDVVMPKMDGITATRLIKDEIKGKIIICSVISDKNKVVEAIKAGASDYIVKPVNDKRLMETINKFTCTQEE
ncbi:response regulator [Pseudobacteroides cellulosolvens]|uniref:Stage 0 sporulation protein A homolog n=1 Tax=Pseudobacteroides cellulosolvens ATCC 35603 = DSM 2933 TaxID=398512 RepID=A0A0L6JU52_9FIRM|nr:response regulator [Pseudobacteroides cellulosolvens]KNY29239.1 response regulator receiver protein [Pseudobacteroides cellulosolvens ATCC 35603 = DSM 2933]